MSGNSAPYEERRRDGRAKPKPFSGRCWEARLVESACSVADEYLLGRAAFADRVLERAAARGELKRDEGFGPRGSEAYIRAVKALPRRSGYRR